MEGPLPRGVAAGPVEPDRRLRVAAVLFVLDGVGFGVPTWWAGRHLLSHGRLPTFVGLFPMYGGPYSERCGPRTFVRLLAAFRLVCAAEVVAGWLLWRQRRSGGVLGLLLLPVAAVFWRGFALPLPPANAVVRTLLVVRAWRRLAR